MSKRAADFADILTATIDNWYDGIGENFAGAADVSGAAVSRWCRRIGVPSARTMEKIAPHIKDLRGRPIPFNTLMAAAYPGTTTASALPVIAMPDDHPLAREVAKMLADNSPLPADRRENLATILDALIEPYRTYLRRRKSA